RMAGARSRRRAEKSSIGSRRSRHRRISWGQSRVRRSMKPICVCVIALAMASDALALTLVKDGRSDYVIVLAKDPLPANRRAVQELQSCLKQMSGAELPIIDDTKHAPLHAILVGPNQFLEADKVLGSDGFILSKSEKRVVIA